VIQIKLIGEWQKAARIVETMGPRWEKAQDMAVQREAQFLRRQMVQNLTSGGALAGKPFAPLGQGTLVMRAFRGFGGTKPLIVTGALRNSISVVKLPGGVVFVGVRRGGPGAKGGKSGANIAEIHEFGASFTVRMTPKMRRFLAAAYRRAGVPFGRPGGGKGSGVLTIRIPARPFVGPVVDRFAKPEDVQKRFWETVSKAMGYDLGKP
jgi:hypothetical protein